MALTKKELLEIIKDVPDEALILVRSRDSIHTPFEIEVVGVPAVASRPLPCRVPSRVTSVATFKELYGGDDTDPECQNKPAVVLVECD